PRGQTRFEMVRRASHWQTRRSQVVSRQIRPGLDESLTVEKHAPVDPARVWNRSGHDEDVANFARLGFSRLLVAPGNTFEMILALESDDFRAAPQIDRRIVFNAPDQIARHACRQSTGTHQDVDAFGGLREKYGRLSGGVSSAHDNHFFVAA